MAKTIIGREKVDYTSRKTNEQVTGLRLHLTGEHPNVEGLTAEVVFISAKSAMYGEICSLKTGTKVDVFYNRYGSVDVIRPV